MIYEVYINAFETKFIQKTLPVIWGHFDPRFNKAIINVQQPNRHKEYIDHLTELLKKYRSKVFRQYWDKDGGWDKDDYRTIEIVYSIDFILPRPLDDKKWWNASIYRHVVDSQIWETQYMCQPKDWPESQMTTYMEKNNE